MNNFISHPLIKPDIIEKRPYQVTIANNAINQNTLVILPTSLGKTSIALLVMAELYDPNRKIIMVAPTKPLIEQHFKFFTNALLVSNQVMFTGDIPPAKRKQLWTENNIIFATPQTIENDCQTIYSLSDVNLLIIDEAHRSTGNYAYTKIASEFNGRILAMTASPGGDSEKIDFIISALSIDHIESRTEDSPDVRKYVHKKEVEPIFLDLPSSLYSANKNLEAILLERITQLREMGFNLPLTVNLPMKIYNGLKTQIDSLIRGGESIGYAAVSLYSECLKIKHSLNLAQCQGNIPLAKYLAKLHEEGMMGGSQAARRLISHPLFIETYNQSLLWKEEEHPKIFNTIMIIEDFLRESPQSKIIVFASYRDAVSQIVQQLKKSGIKSMRFVGQSKRASESGLSQKKQIDILQRFKDGEFQVLVATSVGEEGLDIPSTDLIIFFEPVASEIRSIQRRGRTGRFATGIIKVLITKGTQDEKFYYIANRKERIMKDKIKDLA